MSDLNIDNTGELNNNFTEIKGKESMKENTRSIIIITTFFIFLIIFTVLYPFVLLFVKLPDDKTQIFLSYFEKVFPVISAFAGVIIGYFIGYKKSE